MGVGDPENTRVVDLHPPPYEQVGPVEREEEGDEEDAPEHRVVLVTDAESK